MKKRNVSKMLTTMLSSAMIVSQIGAPLGVMAAEGDADEFGGRFEAEFDQQVDEGFTEESDDFSDVNVYEDTELVGITEDKLVPPTDVKWEKPGVLSFRVVSGEPMCYGILIYKLDEYDRYMIHARHVGLELSKYAGETYRAHFESDFYASGTYEARVFVALDDSTDSHRVFAVDRPVIEWVCPETKIESPTNIHWEKEDEQHFAIAVCDPMDQAESYRFSLYEDDHSVYGWAGCGNRIDMSYKIGDTTEHNYTFKVQALSNDLNNYANGQWSEKSESLVLGENVINTQKDIVSLGKDVNPSNIDQTVLDVKALDNDTLKTSLQTDQDAVNSIATIEATYIDVKGVSVLPAKSDVERIPADKIEMVGAALNVSEGTIQLIVKDQKAEGSALINTDVFTNIIAFDMSVDSSEGIDFSKKLEVPVTISMPIPEGIDEANLYILHYCADGAEELIRPRIENGKAIFAVAHFSTFAFAEKKTSSSSDGELLQGEDGSFYYYINGVVATDMNGYVDWKDSKFYLTNGKVDTTVNGVQIDGSADPLVWYFCANGQVQTQHVGLALYDGEWFYIENGKVAVEMNKFVEYDGGLFAVAAGRIVGEYSGLMQDPENPVDGDWYFFANGQAQTQYTGLAMYDNAWFYVVNGKLAVDYTGPVDYDGATFNVENGMVK